MSLLLTLRLLCDGGRGSAGNGVQEAPLNAACPLLVPNTTSCTSVKLLFALLQPSEPTVPEQLQSAHHDTSDTLSEDNINMSTASTGLE